MQIFMFGGNFKGCEGRNEQMHPPKTHISACWECFPVVSRAQSGHRSFRPLLGSWRVEGQQLDANARRSCFCTQVLLCLNTPTHSGCWSSERLN